MFHTLFTQRPLVVRRLAVGLMVVVGMIAAAVAANSMFELPGENVSLAAEKPAAAAPQLEPVESDMHEFMEYVFEPGYKRLRAALATEPTENSVWKSVKGDSLSLAEGGNLLLMRAPKEDADAWKSLSAAVRSEGKLLYAAARAKDYQAAHAAYTKMLKQCNACHDAFAGGEHQLQP